jgi:hypothetical protein
VHKSSAADLIFFFDVDVTNNGAIAGVATYTTFAYSLSLLTFWNSGHEFGALVIVAASIMAYFCVNPYLLAAWRTYMREVAEALLHSSVGLNNALKSL